MKRDIPTLENWVRQQRLLYPYKWPVMSEALGRLNLAYHIIEQMISDSRYLTLEVDESKVPMKREITMNPVDVNTKSSYHEIVTTRSGLEIIPWWIS